MHITRKEALAVLQLEEGYDDSQADAAFQKLSRRYPPQVFPERFQKIRQALDVLTKHSSTYQQILEQPTIDLSWLAPYIKPASSSSTESGMFTDREYLQKIVRSMMRRDFFIYCNDDDSDEFDDFSFDEFEAMIKKIHKDLGRKR